MTQRMTNLLAGEDGLEFTFESDAAASFLVVRCGARILEYQVLMLQHNRIRHMIPVELVRKDGTACFYYNITSKISLSFFLERRKLNREEFLKLLLCITAAVHDSAGYLLTDSNFVFDPEYIYISPETLEVSLVYIPAMLNEGGRAELTGFISDLVLQHVHVDGFDDGNFVQRILAAVQCETFHIRGLTTLLYELLYGTKAESAGDEPNETADQNADPSGVKQAVQNSGVSRVKQAARSTGMSSTKAVAWNAVVSGTKSVARKAESARTKSVARTMESAGTSPDDRILRRADSGSGVRAVAHTDPDRKEKKNESPSHAETPVEKKPAGESKGILAFVIFAQVIMGGIIYLSRNFLSKIGNNPTTTYIAVAMIVLAVEVLLIKRLTAARLIHMTAGNKSDSLDKKEKRTSRASNVTSTKRISSAPSDLSTTNAPRASSAPNVTSAQRTTSAESILSVPTILGFLNTDKPSEAALGARPAEAAIDFRYTASAGVDEAMAGVQRKADHISCKTELLGSSPKGIRMLKSIGKSSGEEDIFIDKDDFIIGRLEGHADYILRNNAIGKLHAQLLYKDGVCFIKDLNSVNGTFINDKRIECNKEFELKENDRLQLANSEFVYIGG